MATVVISTVVMATVLMTVSETVLAIVPVIVLSFLHIFIASSWCVVKRLKTTNRN